MAQANGNRRLIAALEKLRPHDHLCSIYETQEEELAVAVPFIRLGLERGERCIYIADDDSLLAVRDAFFTEGIDVDRQMSSGALLLATKEQTYLGRGSFNPDWMFTFWEEASLEAAARGFSALRATGETEWVLRGTPGIEQWLEYESRLTRTLQQSNCFALCQYNRRRFSPALILDVIRTHPIVIYRGTVCRNFYYVPPEEFLRAGQTSREVERLLTNIREREQMDIALREQQDALQQAHDELEIRVRERTAELAQANEELQAFTYSVSHDLRTPLRHISGYADILAEETAPRLDPDARKHLELVRDCAQQMGRMIDELLELARMGRRELDKRTTALRPLVEEIVAAFNPDLAGRQVEFQVADLPVVDCDPALMKRVLTNLLSNAIKFTRPRRRAIIQIGQLPSSDAAVVFVRDNGVGFDMKRASKLFGVFQRLHPDREFEGTGIGLAAVQRIIHKHGGRVWAEAQPGKGASFYFSIPSQSAERFAVR